MKKNIRVKITVTLDVNAEAWLQNFQGVARPNIRKDIQGYFAGLCTAQLDCIGCEAAREDEV